MDYMTKLTFTDGSVRDVPAEGRVCEPPYEQEGRWFQLVYDMVDGAVADSKVEECEPPSTKGAE